jgi:hypothetical protein
MQREPGQYATASCSYACACDSLFLYPTAGNSQWLIYAASAAEEGKEHALHGAARHPTGQSWMRNFTGLRMQIDSTAIPVRVFLEDPVYGGMRMGAARANPHGVLSCPIAAIFLLGLRDQYHAHEPPGVPPRIIPGRSASGRSRNKARNHSGRGGLPLLV